MDAKIKSILKKAEKKTKDRAYLKRSFYELRSILGNWWAIFFILLGARQAGKSYAVTSFYVDQFINLGRPFYWIRLTDKSAGALLMNNAEKLVDPDIRRMYGLDLVTIGNRVYNVTKRDKEGKIKEKKLMCTVMALSNFYNDKGSAYYDKDFLNDPTQYYNIAMDEMNRELNEKKTFDICYSFVNQIENLVRETQNRIRVIMIGNKLEDASDLLSLFNFIPETFGRYKLVKNKKTLVKFLNEINKCKSTKQRLEIYKKYENVDFGKRAVIENMPLTDDYKARRKGSIASILMPDASTFSNDIKTDDTLITKRKLVKPTRIIKFSKDQNSWFTVWDDNIICKYNKEKIKDVVSMRPFIDEFYQLERAKQIFDLYHTRCFLFRNLITFKFFQKELELLKPKG